MVDNHYISFQPSRLNNGKDMIAQDLADVPGLINSIHFERSLLSIDKQQRHFTSSWPLFLIGKCWAKLRFKMVIHLHLI